MPPSVAARLGLIEESLARIEAALAQQVPAADARQHIAETEATADQVDALATAAPIQSQQLDAITAWMGARMSGAELTFQFDDLLFVTKQLASISEGWRSDLLGMRGDIRRLSAQCEQVLRARVDDDERRWTAGDAERRKAARF